MTERDRFAAWLLTGPVGRFVAFCGDLGAAWGRWALGKLPKLRRQ